MDYRTLVIEGSDWAIWPIISWDPYESNTNVSSFPSPPSRENIFGTDDRGRDVAARLLYGFRESMKYSIAVFLLSYLLGITIGALMGYFGGIVDLLGQRFLEIWESMPVFMLLLTLITIFKPDLMMFVLISSAFGWMGISVYVRAEFLKLRHREFVEAGRAIGASNARLIFRHILPNSLGPVLTFAPFVISGGISSLAVLDYLGFGLQPPTPSWGELLSQAKSNFTIAWWLATYPSAALFFSLLLLSLIGDAIRDAFDPRAN
jgi:microcin C transport system permease protein